MTQPFGPILRHIRQMANRELTVQETDGELLQRFTTTRDEAAFTALVCRHGSMVLGVCRRVLGDVHAAEDAFQATFLALVRRPCQLDRRGTVGSWLYTVAYHVAVRIKSDTARRRKQEGQAFSMKPASAMTDQTQTDLRTVIDQELARLPEKYRAPVVLCYLESKTNEEAAHVLGWTKGTVSGRLARARELLNRRLTKRGLALTVGGLGSLAQESVVSAALLDATASTALLSISGNLAAGPIAALAEGALQSMSFHKLKMAMAALLVVIASGTAAGFLLQPSPGAQSNTSVAAVAPLPDDAKATLKANVLRVELNAKGELLAAGQERPLSTMDEIEDHLNQLLADLRNKQQGAKAGSVKTTLLLCAPPETESSSVCSLLRLGRRVGFLRIQMETIDRRPKRSLPIEYTEGAIEPHRPELLLLVKAATEGTDTGGLAGVVAQTPTGEYSLEDAESLEKYLRLRRVEQDITDKESLSLRVDGGLKFDQFIRVVDACLSSGFRRLHFVSDPNDLHAEAKLKQAAFCWRLKKLEVGMIDTVKRLEKTGQKADEEKAAAVKAAIVLMTKKAVDVRATMISEGLTKHLLTLVELRDLIEKTDVLIKALDVVRSSITDANDKLKDDDLQAVEKAFQKLEDDQRLLQKLLQRYQKVIEGALIE